MKKYFTLLTLAAVALSASAASPQYGRRAPSAELDQKIKTVSTRAAAEGEIIYNPEGEYRYFTHDVKGFEDGNLFAENGDAALVVFGEDNTVYFQDIIPLYFFRSFVKGTLENGVITLPMPQLVSEDYLGFGLPVSICVIEKNGSNYTVADIDKVEYLYDSATGGMTLQMPSKNYLLGYAFTGSWEAIGDCLSSDVYTPFDGVNTIPEGLEEAQYMFREGDVGYPLYKAEDEANIYIKGLSQDFPQGVFTAKKSGNYATVAQNQILGAAYGAWVKTKCLMVANDELVNAPENEFYVMTLYPNADLIVGYDEEYYLGIVGEFPTPDGQVIIPYYDMFDNFTIFEQSSYEGVPANPYNLIVNSDNVADDGAYIFGFEVPTISTDYNVLDTDYLYYRIYLDGEVMEFEADPDNGVYDGVEGIMTEIPFNFTNDWDIWAYTYSLRLIQIYQHGITTLGVQLVYRYGDTTTESSIVTINVETGEETITPPAGVESLMDSEVSGVVYYDLNGRKVNDPARGIYVKKTTKSNGEVVTKKVVVR